MSGREWFKRLALLVGSTVVALVIGELVLEARFPLGGMVYRLDSHCLYRLLPGSRKLFIHAPRNGGRKVLVTINSRGYRGPEFSPRKTRPRVVVFGDSFIESEFSPLAETYVSRLQSDLSQAMHTPVETINAGVVGYGPDQACVRMETELRDLAPDLVVLELSASNDFGDLIRNKLYRLGPDGALVRDAFVIDDTLRQEFQSSRKWTRRFVITRALRAWVRGGSRPSEGFGIGDRQGRADSVDWVAVAVARQQREFDEYVVRHDCVVRDFFHDLDDFGMSTRPNAPETRYKVALMSAVLERVGAQVKAAGAQLLAVVVPSPADACDHYSIHVDRSRYPEYRPDMISNTLAGCCAKDGIDCLDLYGPFRALGADPLFFQNPDGHWNALGQREGARLTCATILRDSLLRGTRATNGLAAAPRAH